MNVMKELKKLPGISYLRRYWWVLLAVMLTYAALRSDSLFAVVDIFVYLPVAFALWVALPLAWRNLFNRRTTDEFVDQKRAVSAFADLTEREKTWFTMIQMGFYLLGSAIIVAAFVIGWIGHLVG